MILALDVGNTNIVLGVMDEGKILTTARLQSRSGETEVEYAIRIKSILDLYGIDRNAFDGAIISSVVGSLTDVLRRALVLITGLSPIVVNVDMKHDLNIVIDEPHTLGCDLFVGGVAAKEYYSLPAIMVDMGTATTIFAIDGESNFLGGAIMPGLKLSYAALSSGTSLLPDIGITPPEKCVSTNTVDCMRSGAVFGTAAMIDGMVERMEKEMGEKCTVIATGGLARCIKPYCKTEMVLDDNLILKGLWVLFQQNK